MAVTAFQSEVLKRIARSRIDDLGSLSRKWHEMVWRARETVKLLPPEEVGKVVMTREGELFRGDDESLKAALAAGEIVFHEGTIGGAWPMIIDSDC